MSEKYKAACRALGTGTTYTTMRPLALLRPTRLVYPRRKVPQLNPANDFVRPPDQYRSTHQCHKTEAGNASGSQQTLPGKFAKASPNLMRHIGNKTSTPVTSSMFFNLHIVAIDIYSNANCAISGVDLKNQTDRWIGNLRAGEPKSCSGPPHSPSSQPIKCPASGLHEIPGQRSCRSGVSDLPILQQNCSKTL